jgi:Flp pilus assembly pilin Flp
MRLGVATPFRERSNAANRGGLPMLWNTLKRLVLEEDGMEMVEWAIVGVVFAVAAAAFWGTLGGNISAALDNIGNEINPGT